MHAAEVMADEMKGEILAGRGVKSASRSQQQDVMFQEFMSTMALMASPESATGLVPSAMYLDEESQALLFKIQHQADDLPKTLQEALIDPRAAVITEAIHPFSIVDVNDAWVGLCGYNREEALHQDIGKLLQGPETNHHVARTIVPQLMQEHFANVVLTNYTKQGQRFENKLKAGLISDEQGTKYFVGVFEALLVESSEGGRMMATA
jgi:PAS domain S-box-containing protein